MISIFIIVLVQRRYDSISQVMEMSPLDFILHYIKLIWTVCDESLMIPSLKENMNL